MTIGHDLSGVGASEAVSEVAVRAVSAWSVGQDASVRLLTISENATFVVEGPSGCAILRIHRLDYHQPSAIHSELDWLEALRRDAVVPTAAVLPAIDGARMVEVADPATGRLRCCVMFEHVPGAEPRRDHPDSFEHLGEITARLHRHAEHWDPPVGFDRFVWEPDLMVGEAGRWGRWRDGPGVGTEEVEILERLRNVVVLRLDSYGRNRSRFGLIHADLRLANLLVDGEGKTTVIDFDDCGYGWLLYDLATAVSFFEHDPAVPELIDRWLCGYRSVRPLGAADEAEIWTFILLRRMLLLAWIGSHGAARETAELSEAFAGATCELAELYLNGQRGPGLRGSSPDDALTGQSRPEQSSPEQSSPEQSSPRQAAPVQANAEHPDVDKEAWL